MSCILPKELVGILTWHVIEDLVKKILHFVVSIKATETAKQGTLLSKKKNKNKKKKKNQNIYNISKSTQKTRFKCYWICFSKKKKM